MKKLLPLVFMLVGIGGGVGAGLALRPNAPPPHAEASASDSEHAPAEQTEAAGDTRHAAADRRHGGTGDVDYVKLNNQFVVPVVDRDRVEAMMVMSLSLEMAQGQADAVYQHELKLRDSFLQVMFDHANMGGFAGVFTDTAKLDTLRNGLTDVANGILGESVKSVLITDFARQQM
ncbi:flagellar basal body-associated FliL family protein [Roseovarius sp. S4756]|uniref:flagellar basal body-associated FliL family protein n=1 Tax=Roseovarius maritimus TaxID=3342637 RepID=UPI00372A728C